MGNHPLEGGVPCHVGRGAAQRKKRKGAGGRECCNLPTVHLQFAGGLRRGGELREGARKERTSSDGLTFEKKGSKKQPT